MTLDTKEKFSKWTIVFHWAVAFCVISLLCVGTYMKENKAFFLYQYHKSIGVLVFVLLSARIVWRFKNGWPTPLNTRHAYELKLARISHWILLIGTIMFPISGMTMSIMGGHGLHIFAIELLPVNFVDGQYVPVNASLSKLGATIHHWLKWIIGITILIHIAAALRHHFWYKDDTLRRMFGKRID